MHGMGDNEKQASEARQSGVFILIVTGVIGAVAAVAADMLGWMDMGF
jgi:hypothetical protein